MEQVEVTQYRIIIMAKNQMKYPDNFKKNSCKMKRKVNIFRLSILMLMAFNFYYWYLRWEFKVLDYGKNANKKE
jgi:hypothetical protein